MTTPGTTSGSVPPDGPGALSGAEREHRAPRARLMIVGAPAVDDALRDQLRQSPIEVQNVFEAIGELTECSAEKPIVAAVVHEDADEGECAAALRRIDPSVVLILAVGAGVPLESSHGFDEAVPFPLDVARLKSIVGRTLFMAGANGTAPAATNGATAPAPRDAVAPNAEPPTAPAPAPMPTLPAPAPGSAAPVPAPMIPIDDPHTLAPPGAEGVIAPPRYAGFDLPAETVPAFGDHGPVADQPLPNADVTESLGDTDLIRAVMERDGALVETALELMRQHTGWTDVEVQAIDTPRRGPAGAARVAIVQGTHSFGDLVATRPTHAQLAPWARWLARWMDLDHSYHGYREMSYRDELTGAWNRRYFNRFLRDAIDEGRARHRQVTVMVFDIDDFKRYNDEFSHEAGDVILCETVALLKSVIRTCDRVCRIGGDEFAVIFADLDEPRESGSHHPDSVELIARRFQQQICAMHFPKLGLEAPGTLSISGGLSSYPWDGDDPTALLRLADERALESKRNGKNDITFGPGGVSRDDAIE